MAFCNPELSALITEKIGTDEWTLDMSKLRALEEHATDPEFQKQWKAVKQTKKDQLAALIKEMTGDTVDTNALFDIHVRAPLFSVHVFGLCCHDATVTFCSRMGRRRGNPPEGNPIVLLV